MKKTIRYVGLDVHKDTIVIAVADEARQREDGHAASMARNAVEGAGSGCPSGGRRDAHEGREGDEARQREDGTALTPPD